MSGEEIKELVATVASLVETIRVMPGVNAPVAVTVQPAQIAADVVRADKSPKASHVYAQKQPY